MTLWPMKPKSVQAWSSASIITTFGRAASAARPMEAQRVAHRTTKKKPRMTRSPAFPLATCGFAGCKAVSGRRTLPRSPPFRHRARAETFEVRIQVRDLAVGQAVEQAGRHQRDVADAAL